MTTAAIATTETARNPDEKHPKGLYVLFATEMWERFSFYSMLAMFVLYLSDSKDGFGWTEAESTELYSTYLMFVYASPLIGGWIADRKLGYRRSIMIGGLFFMAGHLLLSIQSISVVYAALACLVIGNGFFKPNVSTMVGNLYPEGSPLKDRAYSIFYMGINVGATIGPLVVGSIRKTYGFHPAFAIAAGGMFISVAILWGFKGYIQAGEKRATGAEKVDGVGEGGKGGGMSEGSKRIKLPIDDVPDSRRIGALIVIYLIVIVFWMIFHQNGSTLTYWARDNTAWSLPPEYQSSINPFFIVTLTFPLVWLWKWLNSKGFEPSTPAKIALGMLLTAISFYILYFAGKAGGDAGRVSPLWLIGSYAVISVGELMLSPMGLSLVSKVAPARHRGLMMGGWFVATAIGNKLTMIGVFWDKWLHSTFFAVLGTMALVMSIVLLFLLKPLKKAMPGV